jgi:hypothetical protein
MRKRSEQTASPMTGDGRPLVEFRLEVVALELIDQPAAQPSVRTEDARIKLLQESIAEHGLVVPPVIVPKQGSSVRYEALDGNRRIAGSRNSGVTHLQCLIVELSAAERASTFFTANCLTEPVNGKQRIQAWAQTEESYRDDALEAMKPFQAKQIQGLIDIFGEDEVCELASDPEVRGFANIARYVRAVLSWCEGRGYKKPTPIKIARWIIQYKCSRLIDTIARNPVAKATEAVVNAIHAGRDYSGPRR